MTRLQLEHILRAAGSVTDEKVILVLGSQSIHGSVDPVPAELLHSMEADVFPLKAPAKVDVINGSIGEITHFQETFGYYAYGIPPDACPLPRNWELRLHTIKNENTGGVLGLCLDVADLACSKIAAGREKDLEFVMEMLRHRFVSIDRLKALSEELPDAAHRVSAFRSLEILEGRQRSIGSMEKGGDDLGAKPAPRLDRGLEL